MGPALDACCSPSPRYRSGAGIVVQHGISVDRCTVVTTRTTPVPRTPRGRHTIGGSLARARAFEDSLCKPVRERRPGERARTLRRIASNVIALGAGIRIDKLLSARGSTVGNAGARNRVLFRMAPVLEAAIGAADAPCRPLPSGRTEGIVSTAASPTPLVSTSDLLATVTVASYERDHLVRQAKGHSLVAATPRSLHPDHPTLVRSRPVPESEEDTPTLPAARPCVPSASAFTPTRFAAFRGTDDAVGSAIQSPPDFPRHSARHSPGHFSAPPGRRRSTIDRAGRRGGGPTPTCLDDAP